MLRFNQVLLKDCIFPLFAVKSEIHMNAGERQKRYMYTFIQFECGF